MPVEPVDQSEQAFDPPLTSSNPRRVGLWALATTFFRLGTTSFGGMWGATRKLQDTLVHSKRWLTLEDQQALMVAATLIPAPKFLSFGGLVGFRLGGWSGGVVALVSLIGPGFIFVLLGVILLTPELLGEPLIPVRRAVSIGVIGLLFGNAYHQLRNARVTGRNRVIGTCLAVSVVIATIFGVPLLLASLTGFAVGAYLIRAKKQGSQC